MGRRRPRRGAPALWIGLAYLAVSCAFWGLAARRLWVAVVAGAAGLAEIVCLHVVLGGAGAPWPSIAGVLAALKYGAFALLVGLVAARLVRRFPAATALGGVTLVAALLVVAWVADRDTEGAHPDVGRIVSLRAGHVQVREDGPRDAPAVVLVHGYAASMRWWDGVVPQLARELRVIRLDLLGHGGSEKPRAGYSMENQAEVVAQAMDALGVRRAAVVGHSMGGIVATALVERHPERVSRLMTIGTPPDDEDAEGGLLASAAFAPVVGQVNHALVGDRVVRWVVEQGFAPEFDPPDRIVHDIFGRTTWRSFSGSSDALSDYWEEAPLHERLRGEGVPVTAVLGEEERHTERSVRLYNSIPGARTVVMEGLDHSPQVESPARTAALIAAFARER
ncbi:MAG TPA: alpha/beta fold hydrolase [Thermoleophilaceae bacterium]